MAPQMKRKRRKTISQLFAEGKPIDDALAKGVREALSRHKKLGQSVAVWEDGKVVLLPPEKIRISKR
jgi:hypothetical protein